MTRPSDDHKAEAARLMDVSTAFSANTSDSHEAAMRVVAVAANGYAQAQVHATLALVDAVDRLTASFGQCEHGYTICPYCIRSGIEGFGL